MKRVQVAAWMLLLSAASLGCEQVDYRIAPVTGRVTLDGKPLAEALVTFQPIGLADNPEPGPGSYGRTDAEGNFELLLVDKHDSPGAVVGSHRVLITTATFEGGQMNRSVGERVPPRYRDGRLQFTVPEDGSTSADFDLLTRERRRSPN